MLERPNKTSTIADRQLNCIPTSRNLVLEIHTWASTCEWCYPPVQSPYAWLSHQVSKWLNIYFQLVYVGTFDSVYYICNIKFNSESYIAMLSITNLFFTSTLVIATYSMCYRLLIGWLILLQWPSVYKNNQCIHIRFGMYCMCVMLVSWNCLGYNIAIFWMQLWLIWYVARSIQDPQIQPNTRKGFNEVSQHIVRSFYHHSLKFVDNQQTHTTMYCINTSLHMRNIKESTVYSISATNKSMYSFVIFRILVPIVILFFTAVVFAINVISAPLVLSYP
jgi:hypothetical protein